MQCLLQAPSKESGQLFKRQNFQTDFWEEFLKQQEGGKLQVCDKFVHSSLIGSW